MASRLRSRFDGRTPIAGRRHQGEASIKNPGFHAETGGASDGSVTPKGRGVYIVFILRTIASAIWRVPTAVGSLRSAFMS